MRLLSILDTLVVVLYFSRPSLCKKKDAQKSSLQLLEKESKRLEKTGCKSTKQDHVTNLRVNRKWEAATACLLQTLQASADDGWAWSQLGDLYDRQGEKKKGSTCFQQAAKLTGKLTDFVRKWHFLGPFVIGKIEMDGDPIASWGGIANVSSTRFNKKAVFYSELVQGGEVKWSIVNQKSAGERLQVSPQLSWNDLVMSLGSMAITEWQGWLVGEFAVNDNDVKVLVQTLGVPTFYIDNIPIAGEVYHRDQYWFSVPLTRGIHTVYIQLRTKVTQQLIFNLKQAGSNVLEVLTPPYLPDLLDGRVLGHVIPLPIANHHPTHWIKNIRISLVKQEGGPKVSISQPEISRRFSVAPGQVRIHDVYITANEGVSSVKTSCQDMKLTLQVSGSEGNTQVITISLRCRTYGQSFVFTFLDHDGSVQHAAAIPPLQDCVTSRCPVLLTHHGTGVSAQNQADSYKRMEGGDWKFGIETAWTLAPTRHGAHNWEGPGALTSMTALHRLQELVESASWIQNKVDPQRVIFAGHSMGGHGAWHLATRHADRALAVVSLAGWIKKEEYGDSNVFFRHDISTSTADPSVKAIMESCIAENDADRHVSNLQGVPVLTRIGADDRTVHPFFVRRMYRLLQETGLNVTYSELPKKEHWWWDTWDTNDGGAVNDPQLRQFEMEHSRPETDTTEEGSCSRDGADCATSQGSNRYKKLPDGSYTLTVMNPASVEGGRGVQVLQQTVPMRTSTVKMEFQPGQAILETQNVARFSLYEPDLHPVGWAKRTLEVDGVTFQDTHDVTESGVNFCKKEGTWNLCSDGESFETEGQRGPHNMGPARRVAEHRFLIVTGTHGPAPVTAQLERLGVYLANLFHLTSDTSASMVKDTELRTEDAELHNLIVIGGPKENSWAADFINTVPLGWDEKGLTLGDCRFTHPRTGALFLARHAGKGLSLVLMGNSLSGLEDVVQLGRPTIPPMTRSPFSNLVPDFVLTGPEFQRSGPGGYLCAGFWGNHWDLRRELVSCAC
ncbi:PREDICTED: uncharacterized secreted protein ARB_06907-like [Branchiostoma belcheri]|uniref:Uncharacterized secreted protein ARB_06907-like n=1 Tax=Branchiostoma belcheri TaxID=7741 RepID=A0A6P4ZJ11_BRABE|nr:PREDICTED: uncharacterized secreted protein ARB_06907-like [Branchiostoma belcheri]